MLAYETLREIELFVLREARLLDSGEFEAWLDLYAPQGIYWMPSRPDQTDPLGVASIIYEDHAILAIRVQRLLEARALVLTPMPRTTHLVSNIEVLEGEGERIHRRDGVHLRRASGRTAAALFGPADLPAGSTKRHVSYHAETSRLVELRWRAHADHHPALKSD